jgi:hypothetical protein
METTQFNEPVLILGTKLNYDQLKSFFQGHEFKKDEFDEKDSDEGSNYSDYLEDQMEMEPESIKNMLTEFFDMKKIHVEVTTPYMDCHKEQLEIWINIFPKRSKLESFHKFYTENQDLIKKVIDIHNEITGEDIKDIKFYAASNAYINDPSTNQ